MVTALSKINEERIRTINKILHDITKEKDESEAGELLSKIQSYSLDLLLGENDTEINL